MIGKLDPGGANWHRWDPHLHAPGTLLNDQFKGDWENWLSAIENSEPPIRALGVTDYYLTESYAKVLEFKRNGRLPQVELIFPNVELRLDLRTDKGGGLNIHLLVRPDAPDLLERLAKFVGGLTIQLHDRLYRCDRADLIALGMHNRQDLIGNNEAALREGAQQFKVPWEKLRDAWKNERWARENILIAVDAGASGTSGLQHDQFQALRKEIQRFAHIIFSPKESDRKFWLGLGVDSLETIRSEYNGPKPCIHGCDCHRPDEVGKPDQDRFCWIKGDITFEGLEQAVFDPELRVNVGPMMPAGVPETFTMASVGVQNAPWFPGSKVVLNTGLVAIIGARGSGKTALADIIAAGGGAANQDERRSFVGRAKALLGSATATLDWRGGKSATVALGNRADLSKYPDVQYLSQQFVERLCSSEGIEDDLLGEMHRVIFDAQTSEQRMGASDFAELLEASTSQARANRYTAETTLRTTIQQLYVEWQRRESVPTLVTRRDQLRASIEQATLQRNKLIGTASDERSKALQSVLVACEEIRARVEALRRRIQALEGLTAEVLAVKNSRAFGELQQLRNTYSAANFDDQEWAHFLRVYASGAEDMLDSKLLRARDELFKILGPHDARESPTNLNQSLIPADSELGALPLSLLEHEAARLRRLIGIDQHNAFTLRTLSAKLEREQSELNQVLRDLELAESSQSRTDELDRIRRTTYQEIIRSIEQEETALNNLYAPLKARLTDPIGAESELSFSVRRKVDIKAWADKGEGLMDLRRQGPFQRANSLLKIAEDALLVPWGNGTSADVAAALASFSDRYLKDIVKQSIVSRKERVQFGQWWQDVLEWLYSTSHITVDYSICYDSVEIERLSPGTRGIVLLLLYLAIDQTDDRPLIIDQPEENLDPRSIYTDIVRHFRRTKLRRQIIMVTHNANLVVNADADQIIVAVATPHDPGQLPTFSYESGGLENPDIRKKVCEILEGGTRAFQERARRLRIR